LIDDPAELSRRLRRVEIVPFRGDDHRATWDELAQELGSEDQVLCIVNTRKDCRDLFDLMPEGTIHLSALMCPEHRSEVVLKIKEDLGRHETIRVISTQLVEAGVDFDFPVVYRALAGFDSIAQAAGRCNREGRLNQEGKLGRTVVFKPPKDAPPGLLLKGQNAGDEILRLYPYLAANLDPEVFARYFKTFYQSVISFDEKGIMDLLAGADADEAKIQFRTAASRFSLIENAGQAPVVVWYGRGKSLVAELERTVPHKDLLRRLQRFTVMIPERVKNLLVADQYLRPILGLDGVWTQTEMVTQGKEINLYDPVFGLKMEGPQLGALDFQA
jgi:CRISPR-associated endonuclease/helicase Cas3